MCKAITELIGRGRREGREEGIQQSRAQGIEQGRRQNCGYKYYTYKYYDSKDMESVIYFV